MRARRGRWGLVGTGWATALLALALLVQASSFGRGASRAPAFDPAHAICAAHPDPVGVPDGGEAPAGPHDLCCISLCGTAGLPPPVLLPAPSPVPPPPARLGPAFPDSADGCLASRRRCFRHGARAPPVPA